MVNMLDEALTLQVKRQNIGYRFPMFTSNEKSPDTAVSKTPEKEKSFQRYIIPAGVMGSGAVLLYLGLRSPNVSKKIQALYQKKLTEISREVTKYKTYAADYLDKEYKKIIPYIDNYKETHAFEHIDYTARIKDAKEGKDVVGIVDDAFTTMKNIRSQDIKPGVSGMDEFRDFMYGVNHPAYQSLTEVRNGSKMKLLDYSLMPRFKNGEYKDSLQTVEEKLGNVIGQADKKLFDIQNNLIDEHINSASKLMARSILRTRHGLQSSAESIMDYAFAHIGKMYNLGDDFKPLFRTGRSMKTFAQLPSENLKPQTLSENAAGIIDNSYLKRVLETVDFNKLNEKTIKSWFDGIPVDLVDTKQIDMVTDRIRLRQVVNKAAGADEDKELQTIAGKLECLAEKLESYGKEDLLKRCGQDFTNMNRLQLHSRLYYINSSARKIGLSGIEDVDKFMIAKSPEYLDSTFKQNVREILAHPEHYFM